jgi:hypothetical protein
LVPYGNGSRARCIRSLEISNITGASIEGDPQDYRVTSMGEEIDIIDGWDASKPVEYLVITALAALAQSPLKDYY